ncbi:MAG: hypothetical protein JNG90_09975 [Planctomycetaceae bacterium]|nr:hypothetical protein [Planctomycetaceae bacterium]
MASDDLQQLIERIHGRAFPLVVAVTGGGSGAISALLQVPGASRTVLEAIVPYAAEALVDWLGSRPEQFCSSRTARAMAMVAYQRAGQLTAGRDPRPEVLGVGCTASLASDRPKRGPHRAHFAWQNATTTLAGQLDLQKGTRSRAEEEALLARLLLEMIDGATRGEALEAELLRAAAGVAPDESLTIATQQASPAWRALLAGEPQAVGERAAAGTRADALPRGIFPGAFNPRHPGHDAMAAVAARRLSRPVEFELSIANVDKPPLDFLEMAARLAQFTPDESLWFTHAPTFVEKSRIFPGSTFVVGADTIVRIGEPRYYGGATPQSQAESRDAALAEIAAAGCRFLVFGRQGAAGFASLDTISIPAPLRALCDGVGEAEFRADISSTQLRRRAAAAGNE